MAEAVPPLSVRRVLIIKLSALGDVVQALGPMAAIRQYHPNAHITVLTTRPYDELLTMSGYVDDVWLDERPKWYQFRKVQELRNRLRNGGFDVVYDLQTSDRSSYYFRFFPSSNKPLWSGIARGGSHSHANPHRNLLHTIERQAEQLRDAGISPTPFPDLSWVTADTARLGLDRPFVLLVPGGAPHRPGKRWPATYYAALARQLASRGVQPALLGTNAEYEILSQISIACPEAINLCGKTDIVDMAVLGRAALAAVGNDTGPMHILAISGCPSVVLYSHESDPALCAQRGPAVEILRRQWLVEVSIEDVLGALMTVAGELPEPTGGSSA